MDNLFDRIWNSPELKNIKHEKGTYLDHLKYDEERPHKIGKQQEVIIKKFKKVLGIPELKHFISKNNYNWKGGK